MKVLNLGSKKQASFYVACELYKEMAFNQHCKLGLATGGTMTDLYEQLVKLLNKNQLNVDNVSTFNLDEYVGLTASHPQSYHYYMDDMLFKQYPYFNRKNIHIPNGDADDMNAEASKYVDMIAVQDLEKRAKELDEMGADYIAVHTGYDLQAEGQSPLESLRTVKSVIKNSKVAVAGGIKPDTIKDIVAESPDLVIVGGGIANADDPVEAAKQCRAAIEGK